MNKPKLLDLCCKAGGMSMGYSQVGFDVTGVDIEPQPHYPFKFIQTDATKLDIEFLRQFDLISASPPCQKYSVTTSQWRKKGYDYPDLIEPIRDLLIASGKPYVIENVPQAPLIIRVILCGTMFGIRTYRHRIFESNFYIKQPAHPEHIATATHLGRPATDKHFLTMAGHFSGVKLAREITGCHWMNRAELAEAIPPAYSKYIGGQFLKQFKEVAI